MHVQNASNKLYILIYRIQFIVRIPEYPSPAPASMELTASMRSAPLPHPTFRFKSIVEKVRVTDLRAEHLLRHAASSARAGVGGGPLRGARGWGGGREVEGGLRWSTHWSWITAIEQIMLIKFKCIRYVRFYPKMGNNVKAEAHVSNTNTNQEIPNVILII